MVIINDTKFACQSCIKGHRSSACNHTDRPLFEIRKKGRPATQCDNCRDLRRTKRLHVKCACDGRRDPESEIGPVQIQPPTNGNRFGRKIPLVPKLPNGVRDMETSGPDPAKLLSTPSSHSRSTSVSDEISEMSTGRIRPIRSCCSRKAASSPQSISEDGETNPESATKSPSTSSSLGLEFLLPQTDARAFTAPPPPAREASQMPEMMDCLCGPACLCLGCTKHQQNSDGDTIMAHGDTGCPHDCPSCVDNHHGAGWPAVLSSHPGGNTASTLSGQTMTTLSSNWLTSVNVGFSLDLDVDGEYDDEMDAEGSPDPAFCDLPEKPVQPSSQAAKSDSKMTRPAADGMSGGMKIAAKTCCAGKRQSPKLDRGEAQVT